MKKKQEFVIDYIKSLQNGEKISVRSLSDRLGVSEGTVYKAIKESEARGMVVTKPKTGTTRVRSGFSDSQDRFTIGVLVKKLGLSVISGEEYLDDEIDDVIVGDCSISQFGKNLRYASGNTLCILSDRSDFIREAMLGGANILLTGGTTIDFYIEDELKKNRRAVLSSVQDTFTVMRLLLESSGNELGGGGSGLVREWMRAPLYTYFNDAIGDWRKNYKAIFDMNSPCAVVNDDYVISGYIDMSKAMYALPSHKIGNIADEVPSGCVVSEDSEMSSLVDMMLENRKEIAYVVKDGKMTGMIKALDVLRYLRFGNAEDLERMRSGLEESTEGGKTVFTCAPASKGKNTDNCNDYYSAMALAAFRTACRETGRELVFKNISFSRKQNFEAPFGVSIDVEMLMAGDDECIVRTGIIDRGICRLSAVVTFSYE